MSQLQVVAVVTAILTLNYDGRKALVLSLFVVGVLMLDAWLARKDAS